MKTRVITAAVGLVFLAVVLAFFNTILFDLVLTAVCLIAIHEVFSAMGFGIKAIILMKSKSDSRVAEKHYFRLLPAVRELKGIVRAWDVTGDVVCIAEAAAPSMKDLDSLLDELHHLELHTTTYIVFEDTGELPTFPPEMGK